ncbi:MAG: UDP-N-acetylmuramoyl-L-alanine--D-glutamate ligase, partial [Erysipelotrichia bacterium]|nr:UDP-N-acetylmuramoyl-L-alanine--D-glutamate ligase [Erysipelotrichia bacterium]
VVKNPGVNYRDERIQLLHQRHIPVITEIELAYLVSRKQHFIAITGTNGKTTTTTLVYEIFKAAFGEKALLGGNIGIPLCELVLENDLIHNSGYYIALEMSNFQLVDIDKFHPEVATILNLAPDHLDIMKTVDDYYRSKVRIYENMTGNDHFLFNDDDQTIAQYSQKYPINCLINHFSTEKNNTENYLSNGFIYINNKSLLDVSKIKVVGKHNLQNIIVAATIAKIYGIDDQTIQNVIYNFKGVEHRLEFVREINGVKYYNDSKATNTDATITALKSFSQGVILLVGGFEKGLPMNELKKHLQCVKKVIGYGKSGPRIVRDLVGDQGLIVDNLQQAVQKAHELAQYGDTVLLSPTTSSFDQYNCFEQRGEHFKQLVNEL